MTGRARLPPHLHAAGLRRPAALGADRHRGGGRVRGRRRLPLGDHGVHRRVCRVAGTARRSPRLREGGWTDGSLCAASDPARGTHPAACWPGGRPRPGWSGADAARGLAAGRPRSHRRAPARHAVDRGRRRRRRTTPASSWPRSTRPTLPGLTDTSMAADVGGDPAALACLDELATGARSWPDGIPPLPPRAGSRAGAARRAGCARPWSATGWCTATCARTTCSSRPRAALGSSTGTGSRSDRRGATTWGCCRSWPTRDWTSTR